MLLRPLARRKGKKRKKKRKKKNRMKLKIQRASVPDIGAWVTCCTTGGLAVLVSQIKGATTRTWGVLIQRSLIGGFRGLLSPILFFQSRGYGYCCFARAQPGCGGEEERQGGAGVGWAKWMDRRAEPRRGRGARDVRRVLTYRYSISRDPILMIPALHGISNFEILIFLTIFSNSSLTTTHSLMKLGLGYKKSPDFAYSTCCPFSLHTAVQI